MIQPGETVTFYAAVPDTDIVYVDILFPPLSIPLVEFEADEPSDQGSDINEVEGELDLGAFAEYGAGIFQFVGRTDDCRGNAYFIIGGVDPWETAVGKTAIGIAGVGVLIGLTSWIPAAVAGGGGVVRSVIAGGPIGLGVAVLVQQAGMIPLSATSISVAVAGSSVAAVLISKGLTAVHGAVAGGASTGGSLPPPPPVSPPPASNPTPTQQPGKVFVDDATLLGDQPTPVPDATLTPQPPETPTPDATPTQQPDKIYVDDATLLGDQPTPVPDATLTPQPPETPTPDAVSTEVPAGSPSTTPPPPAGPPTSTAPAPGPASPPANPPAPSSTPPAAPGAQPSATAPPAADTPTPSPAPGTSSPPPAPGAGATGANPPAPSSTPPAAPGAQPSATAPPAAGTPTTSPTPPAGTPTPSPAPGISSPPPAPGAGATGAGAGPNMGLAASAAAGAGVLGVASRAAAAQKRAMAGEEASDPHWFYVTAPTDVYALDDYTTVIGRLQPGNWYAARAAYDEWVHTVDQTTGAEGWVARQAVKRQEP